MVVCIHQQGGGFVNGESAGRCPARGRGARPQIVVVSWTRAARCGRVFSRFGCVLRDDRSEAPRRRTKSLKAVSAPPTSSGVVGSAKRTDDGATERQSTGQQVAVSDARRTFDSAIAMRSPRRGHDRSRRTTPTKRRRRGRVLHRWHSVRHDSRSTSTDSSSDADPLRVVAVALRRRRLVRRAAMAWPGPRQRALGPVAIAKSLPRRLSNRIRCTPSPRPYGRSQRLRRCAAAPRRAA